jgi:hypothetical protein
MLLQKRNIMQDVKNMQLHQRMKMWAWRKNHLIGAYYESNILSDEGYRSSIMTFEPYVVKCCSIFNVCIIHSLLFLV